MNPKDHYKTEYFEVLEQDTQRYSSTEVHESLSGGLQPTQVTSRINHHKNQEVRLRSKDRGKETKLEFHDFQVDARPGHRLVCAWDINSGELVRVLNADTDTVFSPNGPIKIGGGIGSAIVNPLIALIPLFNFFFFLGLFPYISKAVFLGASVNGARVANARTLGVLMLTTLALVILLNPIYGMIAPEFYYEWLRVLWGIPILGTVFYFASNFYVLLAAAGLFGFSVMLLERRTEEHFDKLVKFMVERAS